MGIGLGFPGPCAGKILPTPPQSGPAATPRPIRAFILARPPRTVKPEEMFARNTLDTGVARHPSDTPCGLRLARLCFGAPEQKGAL